jgi:hypothetical protein
MTGSPSEIGAWRETQPNEAAGWLSSVSVPWWVAGGWAVDLFLGSTIRPHGDLDVGVLRRDVHHVLQALSSWEVFEAKAGVLTPLHTGETPRSDVHSLWCRPGRTDLWTLELMLDECEDDLWLFRRQPTVRRPIATIIRSTPDGLSYLAPEIQLLYKAQRPRPRDCADFRRTAPLLDHAARQWLADALFRVDPAHAWVPALTDNRLIQSDMP